MTTGQPPPQLDNLSRESILMFVTRQGAAAVTGKVTCGPFQGGRMNNLIELDTVEETKHLVPNLPILAKAVFGEDAHLVDWRRSHGDWATSKLKYGDGLLWLPWHGQLWLIEVEWKEGSNFFDQSRAFAKGKIDPHQLSQELKRSLERMEGILNKASQPLQHGHLLDNIVRMTFERHVKDNYLCPHGWVILGHGRDNIVRLRKDYEEELKARFIGKQHYLLSMARMFQSDVSTHILLEQHWSEGCDTVISIARSILVPAASIPSLAVTHPEPAEPPQPPVRKPPSCGQATRAWRYLKTLSPDLAPEHVRLRLQIDEKHSHDFRVDWNHLGTELLVFSQKSGIHTKPAIAAKEVFGEVLRAVSNIGRKCGTFIDVSRTPAIPIAKYKDFESHVRKAEDELGQPIAQPPDRDIRRTYFDSMDVHKQRRIQDNILGRRELWEAFLERKRMSKADFKTLSEFRPKAIAGFMNFLTQNRIARRIGDLFVLNEAVIPRVRELLDRKRL